MEIFQNKNILQLKIREVRQRLMSQNHQPNEPINTTTPNPRHIAEHSTTVYNN